MIINESEIRQIIRNEIIKKAKRAHAKRITENALSKIRESKNKYSTEIISEVYGDPSYSGTPVAYGSSNPYETGGSQQARPSTSLGPLAGAPAAAPAPAPARRSGLRYSASDTFPIKKGDKDPSGSNRIKKLQAKIGTKADGFYGPKSAAKVKQLHGVEVVSEELYNEIMGLGGRVDVTTGPTGGDQRLGTGGAPRQVTRQTSGGTYRIKKKKKGTIKIDPVRGMEKTI